MKKREAFKFEFILAKDPKLLLEKIFIKKMEDLFWNRKKSLSTRRKYFFNKNVSRTGRSFPELK